jgi:hypothetical protein
MEILKTIPIKEILTGRKMDKVHNLYTGGTTREEIIAAIMTDKVIQPGEPMKTGIDKKREDLPLFLWIL